MRPTRPQSQRSSTALQTPPPAGPRRSPYPYLAKKPGALTSPPCAQAESALQRRGGGVTRGAVATPGIGQGCWPGAGQRWAGRADRSHPRQPRRVGLWPTALIRFEGLFLLRPRTPPPGVNSREPGPNQPCRLLAGPWAGHQGASRTLQTSHWERREPDVDP